MGTIAETATAIRPFRAEFSEEQIDDLRRRIAATRWPSKELAVRHPDRRRRHPLHPRHVVARERAAADHDPWLAGLGDRAARHGRPAAGPDRARWERRGCGLLLLGKRSRRENRRARPPVVTRFRAGPRLRRRGQKPRVSMHLAVIDRAGRNLYSETALTCLFLWSSGSAHPGSSSKKFVEATGGRARELRKRS